MKPNEIKKPPPLPSGYAGRAFAVLVGLIGPALVALTVWLTLHPADGDQQRQTHFVGTPWH
jgi:hypothetical protein